MSAINYYTEQVFSSKLKGFTKYRGKFYWSTDNCTVQCTAEQCHTVQWTFVTILILKNYSTPGINIVGIISTLFGAWVFKVKAKYRQI